MKPTLQRQKDIELNKLREFIRLQGKAISTEKAYVRSVGHFIDFVCSGNWPEGTSSEFKLEEFLKGFARDDCSVSTQNGAFHAVCYYYRHVRKAPLQNVDALRAKRGEQVRQAPSRQDTRKILMAVQDSGGYPTRLICHLIYGCGLRIGDALAIRLKDLDLTAGHLTIIAGKGRKDRFINVPPSLIDRLRLQVGAAEAVYRQASAMGVPTKLPNKLAVKYPKGPFQRRWFWLFPMLQPCADPRGNGRVWWHCLDGPVQNAMRKANKAAGTEGITPHHLRHAWATHARLDGARVEDIQVILGHKDIGTTLRYTHPDPERVPSPIESLQLSA